jgi:hypothetical protein
VSRTLLALYRLDRARLAELSGQLRAVLLDDNRAGFSRLLGLGSELAARAERAGRLVDLFLLPEITAEVAPIFASLRRITKRAALEHVWTSESAALEGRLRAYDVLRDETAIAEPLDRLLDIGLLPWFMRPAGSTGGWIGDDDRAALAARMEALGPSLPNEVNAFAQALGAMSGDALLHDHL